MGLVAASQNPALSLIKAETLPGGDLAYIQKMAVRAAWFQARPHPIGRGQEHGHTMGQTPFLKEDKTVSFGEKLAASEQFLALFREGMDLVSRAAAYLDGEGREEAKLLPRQAAIAYAVESMRLTTRLMQAASWLLLQRAVNEGELTRVEAATEKRRIRLSEQDVVSNADVLAKLPQRLRDLIGLSLRLQARIIHVDLLIYKSRDARGNGKPPPSPVEHQIEQLRAALAAPRVPMPTM
jgi:regulator of CtrA degradation